MSGIDPWTAKLAAWTHDPAEKALILMRTAEGHEGGTVRALQRELFGAGGLTPELEAIVRRADRWAAAADRPQFPLPEGQKFPAWAQVRFDRQAELIHPLSGARYDLRRLTDIDPAAIKAVSLDHFTDLIAPDRDPEMTALAFWRFGPETPAKDLGALWRLLPADTRVPDHTIWAQSGRIST